MSPLMLRKHCRKVFISKSRVLVADSTRTDRKPRRGIYDNLVVTALLAIWYIMDCICGKRLAPMLNHYPDTGKTPRDQA